MARGGGDFTGDSPSSDPALRDPIGSAICGVLGTRARNCWSSVDETGDGGNSFTGVGVCVAVDCVMGEARQSLDGGSASSIETGDRGAAGLAAAAGPAGGLVAGAGPAGGLVTATGCAAAGGHAGGFPSCAGSLASVSGPGGFGGGFAACAFARTTFCGGLRAT